MTVERWAWLIAMSDAPDAQLLDWAGSFSIPPSVEVSGGRLDFDSYVPERRAIRLIVDNATVSMAIQPNVTCVNPVFELHNAPGTLLSVALGNRSLRQGEYAWDGHTLWLDAKIAQPERLRLKFALQLSRAILKSESELQRKLD